MNLAQFLVWLIYCYIFSDYPLILFISTVVVFLLQLVKLNDYNFVKDIFNPEIHNEILEELGPI